MCALCKRDVSRLVDMTRGKVSYSQLNYNGTNMWIVSKRVTLLMLFVLVTAGCHAAQEDTDATIVRVKDGDTFVALVNGREESIRLIGIDAPESYHNDKVRYDAGRTGESEAELVAKGRAASAFLTELLPKGTMVRLEYDRRHRDRYGRLLCYVYLADSTMVNELLVKEGHAIARAYPPNVRYRERLEEAEKVRRSIIGIED